MNGNDDCRSEGRTPNESLGEPFAALIAKKQRLPNWKERWCTAMLKVDVMTSYLQDLGWTPGGYAEVVGLRHDEGLRILKGMANAEKRGRKMAYPLSKAKVTKAIVMDFWRNQDFDLGLEPWEGNCDLCFLKGRGIRKAILRQDPTRADWWAQHESEQKGKQERGWFDKRDSVSGLRDEVLRSPGLFDEMTDGAEEYDTEWGLTCAPDISIEERHAA